ncbi:hypothetical protein UY3_04855 [Chelonia mydas]|uniref:HAT C-terminal dimerisation domain-containing protein n=1 Tax=Chelonia mydas TaxID=8469 RepID=M7CBA0_CHEMY|nr:hypothetical protein UY3_04855 [Chelonia mydas]
MLLHGQRSGQRGCALMQGSAAVCLALAGWRGGQTRCSERHEILKQQQSDAETTESELLKRKINLRLVASDSDDENEHVLVFTALDRYQAEPIISMDACLLEWRLKHEGTYESLALLPRKYLAMPTAMVPCECLFSLSGDIVNKKQTALSPANVDRLVYLSNWLNKK